MAVVAASTIKGETVFQDELAKALPHSEYWVSLSPQRTGKIPGTYRLLCF